MKTQCKQVLQMCTGLALALASTGLRAENLENLPGAFVSGRVQFSNTSFSKEEIRNFGLRFSKDYVVLNSAEAEEAKKLGFEDNAMLVAQQAAFTTNYNSAGGAILGQRLLVKEKLKKLLAGKPQCHLEIAANTDHEDLAVPRTDQAYQMNLVTKPANPEEVQFEIKLPGVPDGKRTRARVASLTCPKNVDQTDALESLKRQGITVTIAKKSQIQAPPPVNTAPGGVFR